ncbi:Helicase associated domain protein [Akkermansiaceae bacterium]|nr:Helicase associated domain protein [Akkermansiaceae bacterium]
MSALPPILEDLLNRKDSQGIKDYLEGLKATEKGLAFEQFLELVYKGNGYAAVRQGGRGDLGADILLYDPKKEGIYCIIQAKNHSSPLNRDDTAIELNKFETLASKKYGCKEFEIISINGFVASALKMKRWRLNLRDWSYVEKLIENYDPNNPSKPNVRLHSHNQTTFDSAIESLHGGSRVACIQATGTGKSYVIAKTMNEFSDGKKLVIAPSHHILKQQKDVVPWLKPSTQFMTYAGARNLEESELKELNPELIVLDEFHRAGAEAWGSGVDRILKNCPDAKVLGTTATPIRYLDGERDMSDELFDEEAVNLPLAEAIQRNILPSPEYVASLYTLNEEADNLLESLSNSALSDAEKKTIKAELEQAKIDWEKTSGVPQILKKYLSENLNNKFIVFCKNKEHLDELEDEVRKWIRKTKLFEDRETYRVYSGYKKSDANLEAFLEAKDKTTAHILLSIDMLNEGIHAPDVGAVLLFRPTESPRIFYQQIGRCLQVGTNSKPIIFDFVNNFQSIRAGDFLNDLQEAGEIERELREEFGLSADYLPEIHVHDESRAILETFQEIDERLGSWEINFQKLVAYKEEHGDCLVPRFFEDKQLATWVHSQRRTKKSGKLDPNKIKRLDGIGFVWDWLQEKWDNWFQQLRDYKEKHGNCVVSQGSENQDLGQWTSLQRVLHRKGKLERHRADALTNLGFSWDVREEAWEESYQQLKTYSQKHGHCLVPQHKTSLGKWVSRQRRAKAKGLLSLEKIKRLNEIGFDWDPDKTAWEQNFQELVDYKKRYENCMVPQGWGDRKLANWVNVLRRDMKKELIEPDRVKRLDDIGFVWNPMEEAWEEKYQELKAYYHEYGDCLVTKSLGVLYAWIRNQRKRHKNGKLDADKKTKLDALGFIWDVKEASWEEKCQELVDYKEQHGNCMVLRGWGDGKLATWVMTQRRTKKSGELDPNKIKRLDEIGFVWDAIEEIWEINFQKLVAYEETYGDCLVPRSFEDEQLATWVNSQRRYKKSGKLDPNKIKSLDEIGFVWGPFEKIWEINFQKLVAYKEEHGDCLVPIFFEDKQLATWVNSQRRTKKSGKLDPKKIKRLNEIGFVWDAIEEIWEIQFQKLLAYKKEHGDCLVPQRKEKYKQLAAWVTGQRTAKRNGKLSVDKIKRLNEIGFVWDPIEEIWEINFKKLVAYKEEYGNCSIPRSFEDKQLFTWVTNQRRSKKSGKLDPKKIKRLNEIGFVWDATK